MRGPVGLLLLVALACACQKSDVEKGNRRGASDSELRSTPPPPSESRTLKQGFTQRPPRDTPGLPPPIAPLLDDEERAALETKRAAVSAAERESAQAELASLLSSFENAPPADANLLVDRLRSTALGDAKQGRIGYTTAEALYRSYIFPHDLDAADREYAGKFVLLEGVVAPHNMLDLADGFKLFEETPYVHEPVLLATEYELSFVRCHLARGEIQKLRDWEEVHVLGVVEGKRQGDVVLRRCVVL